MVAVGSGVLEGVGVLAKSGLRVFVMVGTMVLVAIAGGGRVELGRIGMDVARADLVGVVLGVRVEVGRAVRVAVAEPG